MSSEAPAVGSLSNGLIPNVAVADFVMTNKLMDVTQTYQLCTLCNKSLNSSSQAQAHFAGFSHLTQMQAHGLPLPHGTDLEKLQRASMKATRQQGVIKSHWHNQLPYHVPVHSYQSQQFVAVQNPQANSESLPVATCQLCNVICNSDRQAQAHYAGQRHQTKVQELQKSANNVNCSPHSVLAGSNHVPAAAHPVSVPSHEMTVPLMPYYSGAVPTTVARDFEQQPSLGIDCSQYEAPLQPSRTHRREVLTCDVCLQIFNSKSQASAHFQGIPHQKKCNQLSAYMQAVSGSRRPPSSANGLNLLMCVDCHVTVNSAKQMELHEKGRLHQNRMKERGASVAQVGNEVISNAIFEPSGRSLASDLVGLVQTEVKPA